MPPEPGPTRSTMTEDYLKVIWKAEEWAAEGSPGITTNEIAATLGVGASTVSGNLRKLERDGFIDYTPYRSIALSERGRHVAVGMVRRHRLIELFLVQVMGLRWDEVHDEAELLEHVVSDRLIDRIDELLSGIEDDDDPEAAAVSFNINVFPRPGALGEDQS